MLTSKSTRPVMVGVGLAVAAVLVVTVGDTAFGFTGNPVSGNEGFTVVVEGDAAVSDSANEGRMAVGGQLTVAGSTRINADGGYGSPPRVGHTVQQPATSVGPARRLDFASVFADYRDRATELADYPNTLTLRDGNGRAITNPGISPGTNARIKLTDGVTNVLQLTATDLSNTSTLTFDTPPTATAPLLVVVDTTDVGDNFAWAVPDFAGIGGEQARYVLFDFPTAETITLPAGRGGTLEGTLFAPNAALTDINSSNIEGNVIVREFTHGVEGSGGGEIHDFPFSTTLDCEPTPKPTYTPKPKPTYTPKPKPTHTHTPKPTPKPTKHGKPGKLIVDKIVDKSKVRVGRKVHYTLRATNVGHGTLIGASFTDNLTDVLRHGSISGVRASSGQVGISGHTLKWTGTLAPHAVVNVTFTVTTRHIGTMHNTVIWPKGHDHTSTHIFPRHPK